MKPLRLEMRAIGPFIQETVVEFDRIDPQSLFLIHGPTGSGKTFLFDAITYALYAETPSGREKSIRTDHAPPTEEAYVRFSFELNGKYYRIERILSRKRPKRKGEGDTEESETQRLDELSAWPGGQVAHTVVKKTDVNKRIAALLGLDCGQFKQTILLPQGEFRRLLLAETTEREKLLERLFDTSSYQNAQNNIETMRKKKEKDAGDLRLRMDTLLGSASRHIPDEVRPRPEESLRPDHLRAAVSSLDEKAKTQREQVELLKSKSEEAGKALARAEELARQILAKAEKENERAEKESQRPVFADRERELRLATAAERLKPLLNDKIGAAKDREQAVKQRDLSEEKLKKLSGQLEAARLNASEAPALREGADSCDKNIAAIEPLIKLVGEIAERQVDAQRRELQHGAAGQAANKASREQREKCQEEARLAERLDALKKSKVDVSPLSRRCGKLDDLRNLETDLAAKEKEARRLLGCARKANEGFADARLAYDTLRANRERNLAGELATTLEAGKPCPVCGSREHPSRAVFSPDAPTKEQVEAAHKKMEESREKAEKAANGHAAMEALVGDLCGKLEKSLGELAITSEQVDQELLSLRKSIEKEAERAKEEESAGESLRTLRDDTLKRLQKKCEDATKKMAEADTALKLSQQALGDAMTRWREAVAKGVDKILGSCEPVKPEVVEKCLRELRVKSKDMLEKAACLEETVRDFEKKEATVKGELGTLGDNVVKADGKLKSAETALSEAIASSEFKTEEELSKALRNAKWMDDAAKAIREFHSEMSGLDGQIRQLSADVDGRPAPDLAGLALRRDEADRAHGDGFSILNRFESSRNELSKIMEDIDKDAKGFEAIEKELHVLGKLDDRVRGVVSPKISLKRFFLAQRLEEVLIQASHRLSVLSEGRFTLNRAVCGSAQSPSGLELLVHDSHTGTRRPVNSLSGGQVFLASISMALGLADVVQSRSCGVRMDALFVDEGFGTLDEDTLQLVMKVLSDIGEGRRMVGVISHVPELKRQIQTRIEVRQSGAGSCVELCGAAKERV